MADDKKIIFSMVGLSKNFGPQKRVLNNIYLSFFYGAKIGIIGLNGAGKSTLLKIIAGIEKEYQGEVVWSPGYSVGYLEQDPKLDASKTVREVVQEGVQPIMDMLKEYDEINAAFAEPDADFDKLLARQAELQDKLDAADAWNIDQKLDRAMDALRCPPDDASVTTLSGGETRSVVSSVVATTGCTALRRANEPFGCRKHRLVGTTPAAICRHGDLHHARPLFSGSCGRLDLGVGPRRRYSLEGQLLVMVGAKDQPNGAGRETGEQAS